MERERAEAVRAWENYYGSGQRIGGNPLSSMSERLLMELLPLSAPFLEIGCGTGRSYAHILATISGAFTPSFSYTGIDASPTAVSAASTRRGMNVVRGDVFHLPLASVTFGYVYARNALQGYSPGIADMAAAEISRVMRNGSVLLIEERGPLDRVPVPSGQRHGFPQMKPAPAVLDAFRHQLDLKAISEEFRKRRTSLGTVIVHSITAMFIKK